MKDTSNNIELVTLLDASSSMDWLENTVIKGFNTYIQDQKLERGNATISLYKFSSRDRYKCIYYKEDVKNIKDISTNEYYTDGLTAMYDGIIETIKNTHSKNVFMCIQTDGEENDSKHSSSDVKALILKKKKEGWKFLFLGTNINVKESARKIGLEDSFYEFNNNSKGLEVAFAEMSRGASNYRASLDNNILLPKSYKRF